jgi:lipoprotein-anchoring transpeptidase ErfK/SrfK
MTAGLTRRTVLIGSGLALAGCVAPPPGAGPTAAVPGFGGGFDYGTIYGQIDDNGVVVPALDLSTINPDVLRREVAYSGPYRPGSIVVNIPERRLYLVEKGGRAIRYGVGVGREEALNFQGPGVIAAKAVWPHWAPTAHMIHAMPKYAAYAGGMKGGIDNPLGARALYLYRGGVDTHFRLHGTIEPETIGTPVSSGCIRLFNQDIIDLYNRVPPGTVVNVIQGPGRYADSDDAPPPEAVQVATPEFGDGGYSPSYGEGAYGYPPYSYKSVY